MAWSDAARAAALETRRAHALAKSSGAGRQLFLAAATSPLSRQTMSNKIYRNMLARNLKAFRQGGKARKASMKLGNSLTKAFGGHTLVNDAVASTLMRNNVRNTRR